VDIINDISKTPVSCSPAERESLRRLCEQSLTTPVPFPAPAPSLHPLLTKPWSEGKESALENLLLPTVSQPLSSCGVALASLDSFPSDSPRNISFSKLCSPPTAEAGDNSTSSAMTPLPELIELCESLLELGSLDFQVPLPPLLCSPPSAGVPPTSSPDAPRDQ
jgi:hypothetical protein